MASQGVGITDPDCGHGPQTTDGRRCGRVVGARGRGHGSGGVSLGVGQSGHLGGARRAHLQGQVKCPGPHPSLGLRGCVPAPLPGLHPPEGLQAAFRVLQDGTQVGHRGSRQLAAAEVQGAEGRALPERADQALKGFLEAGLLHPGGPVDLRDCRGSPPLPWPLPAQASPQCPHPAPGPGQGRAQHTQAALTEPAVQQAQLRQGGGHPQGLREVAAGRIWELAVAQPVGEKHTAGVQAPRPPRCTPGRTLPAPWGLTFISVRGALAPQPPLLIVTVGVPVGPDPSGTCRPALHFSPGHCPAKAFRGACAYVAHTSPRAVRQVKAGPGCVAGSPQRSGSPALPPSLPL